MKFLMILILFFFTLSAKSQSVRLKVNFIQNNSCTFFNCDSSFQLSNLESLVYDSLNVLSVDVIVNDIKTYNIYCADPERPFYASCYSDSTFLYENYEFKNALIYCLRHKNIAYESWKPCRRGFSFYWIFRQSLEH